MFAHKIKSMIGNFHLWDWIMSVLRTFWILKYSRFWTFRLGKTFSILIIILIDFHPWFFRVFFDGVPSWPWTHDPSVTVIRIAGLQTGATTPNSVNAFVFLFVSLWECVYAYKCIWRREVDVSYFQGVCLFVCDEAGSLTESGAHLLGLDWLAIQRQGLSCVLLSHRLGLQAHIAITDFLWECWRSEFRSSYLHLPGWLIVSRLISRFPHSSPAFPGVFLLLAIQIWVVDPRPLLLRDRVSPCGSR